MRKRILLITVAALLLTLGYWAGSRKPSVAHAAAPSEGSVPKSYGHLVAAIADQIGTGLVFEDSAGVIRFVTITGKEESELTRD